MTTAPGATLERHELAIPDSGFGLPETPPSPGTENEGWGHKLGVIALVLLPLAGLAFALTQLWSHGLSVFDLVLTLAMYMLTGFGVTVGFHRLFTHRSFKARRWLKMLLAVAGSMAAEGSIVSWVSIHRRHHVYSDSPGDPHSPQRYGPGFWAQIRGFGHAQVGWLLTPQLVDSQRWSPDLLADRDLALISATAPVWVVASLAIPFALGWAVTGTLWGGLLAGLWGGVVRMALLHHVTWSINSICHMFGKRPFRTGDQSRNVPALALLSLGESWHNLHHAFPALARHGVDRGQIDLSARLIRTFEQLGWATKVRWPDRERLATRRLDATSAGAPGGGGPQLPSPDYV